MSRLTIEHQVGFHEVEMVLIYVGLRFDLQGGTSPQDDNMEKDLNVYKRGIEAFT